MVSEAVTEVALNSTVPAAIRTLITNTKSVGNFMEKCLISSLYLNPNPPKDTDGRREDSGRGWVRELQGRWPGVLG